MRSDCHPPFAISLIENCVSVPMPFSLPLTRNCTELAAIDAICRVNQPFRYVGGLGSNPTAPAIHIPVLIFARNRHGENRPFVCVGAFTGRDRK